MKTMNPRTDLRPTKPDAMMALAQISYNKELELFGKFHELIQNN